MNTLIKRLGLAAVPALIAVGAQALPASAATSVSVPANAAGGVSSGIYVRAYDEIVISGSGTAQYGYEGQAGCTGYPTTTPNGDRTIVVNGTTVDCGVKDDPNAKLSGGPIGELIARVGSGPWFAVGTSTDRISSTSGYLYLAYNDSIYSDNTGSYSASVADLGGSGGGGGGGGGGCINICPQ